MHKSLIIFNFRLFYSFNLSVTPYLCLRNHKTEKKGKKQQEQTLNLQLIPKTRNCLLKLTDAR